MERPETYTEEPATQLNAANDSGAPEELTSFSETTDVSEPDIEKEPIVPIVMGAPDNPETSELTPVSRFLSDTDGELPIMRVGPGLARLREARGETLDEVSKVTRLRRDWLMAIEAMNVKLVPASVLNNYLSAYARHLGLIPDDLIARFEQQCGAISEAEEQAIDTTPKDRLTREIKWASIAAAALLVVGGLSVFGLRALNPGGGDIIETAKVAASPVIAPSTISAPLFDDAKLAELDATAAPPLEIIALRKGWIEIRGADGTVFRERVMAEGETYRPRIGAGWTVNARDAGAFAWRIDGTEVAVFGADGTPVYAVSVDAAARDARDAAQPMTASVAEGSPTR